MGLFPKEEIDKLQKQVLLIRMALLKEDIPKKFWAVRLSRKEFPFLFCKKWKQVMGIPILWK
jgi:hypothetical protein